MYRKIFVVFSLLSVLLLGACSSELQEASSFKRADDYADDISPDAVPLSGTEARAFAVVPDESAKLSLPSEPSVSIEEMSREADSDVAPAAVDSKEENAGKSDEAAERIPVKPGILTAGEVDDNLNFAAFRRYLNRQQQADRAQILPIINMSDRVTLHILDGQGQGVSNARVRISAMGKTLETFAGTNGIFYLFPHFDKVDDLRLKLQIWPPKEESNATVNTTLDLQQLGDDREMTITLSDVVSTRPQALDVMLVIDTTGSMSDELNYLTTEFRDIIGTVHKRYPQVSIRFGLVVYRDEGDEYVIRSFKFTDSLNIMQTQLSKQRADGGGDYPEAMERALATAVNEAKWRDGNTARLLFLVADAPPHNENLAAMLEPIRIARLKGLRIYSLAASGVADTAEYLMRTASVLTQARYLFLTDDSGVGNPHAEPKIPCYIVTLLDHLMIRVIASELAGQRLEPDKADVIRTVGKYNAGVCDAELIQERSENDPK